jgi:hypothetical protein
MRGFENGNCKSIRNIKQPHLKARRRTSMERVGTRKVTK